MSPYAGRKADGLQMRLDPRGVLPGAQTQVTGETKRQGHADGDALAVHEPSRIIVGQLLQGMAKGMPKIEQRALSLFRFVGDDDARLGRAADRDRFGARRSASEHVAPIRFQKLEKAAVADQPVFDDLGEAGAKIALAKRIEACGVGQHQRWLMKGADEDSFRAAN